MRIGILPVGQVVPDVLAVAAHGVVEILPETSCDVIGNDLDVPQQAYDKKRQQYNSTTILTKIAGFAAHSDYHRIIGIIDQDIYASNLNYVFGEAYVDGKAGVVSIWRLKPQYYGEEPDKGALQLRTLKEFVHELGHTLGLQHCPRSYCVMHFSNSIFEVDKKQSLFCDQCYLNAAIAISSIGQSL